MVELPQIRGAILEEIVLILLENAGYRILGDGDGKEIKIGSNGLEIRGRGEWHQVDALVAYDFTPSFIYPMRLIVEAKAYLPTRSTGGKVGIDIVRNAVGVLKDVNENYFTYTSGRSDEYKMRRFNYSYAIFSLNGFTKNAQRYAIAHQVFLIQYYYNPLFKNIRYLITGISDNHFYNISKLKIKRLRMIIKDYLKDGRFNNNYHNIITDAGLGLLQSIKQELDKIKGSYFGLLNGEYPIHLTSPLPLHNLEGDIIKAKVRIINGRVVSFKFNNNILYFELPEVLAEIFSKVWGDRREIAHLKDKLVNYITLTGKVDGVMRNLIIKLDKDWLHDYLNTLER